MVAHLYIPQRAPKKTRLILTFVSFTRREPRSQSIPIVNDRKRRMPRSPARRPSLILLEIHAIRNALSHIPRVWESISRNGREPFRTSCVSRLPDTRVTLIRRRLLSTAWNSLPLVPTGRRVSPGYAVQIAAIRISDSSRARSSTSVHLTTKSEHCCTLNTWPRTYSWIFPTANSY